MTTFREETASSCHLFTVLFLREEKLSSLQHKKKIKMDFIKDKFDRLYQSYKLLGFHSSMKSPVSIICMVSISNKTEIHIHVQTESLVI